jgi:hypothetical protein
MLEDAHLEFSLPTQVAGDRGGGHRRTRTGLDQDPSDLFSPTSRLN